MAAVGLTESQAMVKVRSVNVFVSGFHPMKNVLAGRNERALYKMISDGETDQIVGLHLIGPEAAEIQQATLIG